MKMSISKIVATMLTFAIVTNTSAQNTRQVRMPNDPKPSVNIAEADAGYWCAIDLGGGSTTMEGMGNVAMVGASFTNGYRLNQYLKVGVGIGVLYYPNNSNVRSVDNHLAMPLFFNLRGNILSEDLRHTLPWWSVNVGTTIPDGMFFTPSIGLRIGEKRSAFLISIGYTLRKLKTCSESAHSNYSGALMKVGYEF